MGAAVKKREYEPPKIMASEPLLCTITDVAREFGLDFRTTRKIFRDAEATVKLGGVEYTTKMLVRMRLPQIADELIARIKVWQ